MRKFLIVTALAFFAVSANADKFDDMSTDELTDYVNSWQVLTSNERGTISIKPITIKEDESGHKVFWARLETLKPKFSKTDILYVMDCEYGKIGGAGYVKYNKQGDILSENAMPTEYAPLEYPKPDSMGTIFLQGLCK